MSNFMDRLMGGNRRNNTPAKSAKDRLKLVLVTDRSSLSPEELSNMQKEILDVIRKYCRVDEDAVDLKLEQRERDNYLVADIPLSKAARAGGSGSVRLETSLTKGADDDDDDDDDNDDDDGDDTSPEDAAEPAETPEAAKPGGAPQGLSSHSEDTQQVTPPTDAVAKKKTDAHKGTKPKK